MDPRMNGYDGYHSSYQDGEFGYDEQQEYYMDNQGVYHHQHWNNNHQDSCSSSNQYQDPETQRLLQQVLDGSKEINERMKKLEEQREKDERVLDDFVENLESPIDEEIDKEEHLANHKERFLATFDKLMASPTFREAMKSSSVLIQIMEEVKDERIIEEESAKGDSKEPTPKTLTMEKCVLPKVKESLQTLLENDGLGEIHSKVGHLKFLLANKEMVEEVLQSCKEELKVPPRKKLPIDTSTAYMGTMYLEATSMEKEEPIRSKDVIQVEHVVKTTKTVRHDPPLVEKRMENLQPVKHTKRRKRKKPKGTKGKGIEPKPPFLIFKPLTFIDGKLECKVSSKGGAKPFSKVKILLERSPKGKDWGTINEAMIKTFGMKLGDRGPLFKSDFPITPNG